MRLTPTEIQQIKRIITACDPDASIYLFGSRTDDLKRGGDIDLLVFSKKIHSTEKRVIKLRLYDALGEQKIDLLVATDMQKPFVRIALAQGIKL